jgi:hypothetical protein
MSARAARRKGVQPWRTLEGTAIVRLIIAGVTAAACSALTLMLLLVQPKSIPAGPHGSTVDHLVDRHQDLQNVDVRAAR